MRVSRTTGAMSGLVIVVLGIWGGLIPFIGPYFNYSFGPNTTWHYTVHRLWLDILPGAAAVLGGLMIMNAKSRVDGTFGSWLALAGGAWFAVGPPVSRLWDSATALSSPIGAPYGGINRQVLEQLGYYYGVGVLIVGFAAFSLGRFVTRPALVSEDAELDSLAEVRAADRRPAREPLADQPMTERRAAEPGETEQPVADRRTAEPGETEQPVADRRTAEPAETESSAEESNGDQPATAREREPIRWPPRG